MAAFFLFLFTLFDGILAASVFYGKPYQLQGTLQLNGTDRTSFSGHRTMYGSNSSIIAFATNWIECRGERSCSDINSIIFNINLVITGVAQSPELMCEGSYSCASVPSIRALSSVRLNAFGYKSMEGSNIDTTSENGGKAIINCIGYLSCAHATIRVGRTLTASGAYSLMNSLIESNGEIVDIYLTGYYSAYGATLHCKDTHTCYINCESITGCFMMHLICDGECQIITAYSSKTIPPITNVLDSNPISNILMNDIMTILENSIVCSNESRDNHIDPYVYYQSRTNIVFDNMNSSMCCRGADACSSINITYENVDDSGSLLKCGSDEGCDQSSIDDVNHVFCTGRHSCRLSEISNASNVFCAGHESCDLASIYDAVNIWCNAEYACELADIYANDSSVVSLHLMGDSAGARTRVHCETAAVCNIYCLAKSSCAQMELIGDGLFIVECDDSSECPIGYTFNPTMQPSRLTLQPIVSPSKNPTANTYSPTFLPTMDPLSSNQIDIETTNTMKSTEVSEEPSTENNAKSEFNWVNLAFIVTAVVFLCSFLLFCQIKFWKRKKLEKSISMEQGLTSKEGTQAKIEIVPGVNSVDDDGRSADQDKVGGTNDDMYNKPENEKETANNGETDGDDKSDTQGMYDDDIDEALTSGSITKGHTTKGDEYETTRGDEQETTGGDDV